MTTLVMGEGAPDWSPKMYQRHPMPGAHPASVSHTNVYSNRPPPMSTTS